MIIAKNVTKIFNSKKKNRCVALDNVSFVLPDTGCVFIVGKSGSGKTTLLSLIGGLDKYDSGELLVDGQELSKLKGTKFDYYRNQKIGFIFQDFQLFDELTVYENIKLGLDFINDLNYEKISKALEEVDLKGFENRYPKELSGGEKQRVAIARILVKNPSIILADEPTGNLDPDTTNIVLNILKKISKDRLVLIVSHNSYDAHNFADYILELQDGKFLGTYKRSDEIKATMEVSNGVLRLPYNKEIDKENIDETIQNINSGIDKIIQDDLDFVPYIFENAAKVEQKDIKKKHISFFNAFKRGFSFLKNSLKPMIVFSLITSSLFSLIIASQAVKDSNAKQIIENDISNYKGDYYYVMKDYDPHSNDNFLYGIEDNFNEKLKDAGYNGKIYNSYDSGFTIENNYYILTQGDILNFLIIDENFLNDRFGKIEYEAIVDEPKSYGIYVSDFLIDVMNILHPEDYKDYKDSLEYTRHRTKNCYVNGIIKTDYKEKYKKFLPYILNIDYYKKKLAPILTKIDKKLYYDLTNDLRYYYFNGFSFNENFINDYVNGSYKVSKLRKAQLISDGKPINNLNNNINFYNAENVNMLSANAYKDLTGKTVNFKDNSDTVRVEPFELEFEVAMSEYLDQVVKKTYKLTFNYVTKPYAHTKSDYRIYLNRNDPAAMECFKEISFIRNGVILDKTADMNKLLEKGCFENNFVLNDGIILTTDIVDRLNGVFNKIFSIIISALILCTIIALIFYGIYLVKSNVRTIGICKSLGARTIDMLIILSCNLFATVFLTIIIYSGLAFAFMKIVELILQNAILNSTAYIFNANYQCLFLNKRLYFSNMAFILILSVVSFVVLFIKINKLKPLELIKKHD